jgi:glycosyltransferase involved in cell wall biosynthesis
MITILLSTYNGERYLEEQIESLLHLEGVKCTILVRDDGSTDGTISILEGYSNLGVLSYYTGNNLKPAHSFFDLINKSPNTDHYALCDQDDYWEKNKLQVAYNKLKEFPSYLPSLYFSKAETYDENLNYLEGGNYPKAAYSLGTALLRNNATGCTMVFNKCLRDYLKRYTPNKLLMHDHWIYLLCLALDGNVVYDSDSYIKYRQHAKNVVGAKSSILDTIKRSGVFSDTPLIRSTMAENLLTNYRDCFSEENVCLIEKVASYRTNLKSRLSLILDSDIKSGNCFSDLSVFICIILGIL